MTAMIACSGINLHPDHIIASFDKTLYGDCRLYLLGSFKVQTSTTINRQKSKKSTEALEHQKLLAGADSS